VGLALDSLAVTAELPAIKPKDIIADAVRPFTTPG
jgi:hypothetical protein